VLIYGAVDNDWERPFMKDIAGMRRGLEGVEGMEVILLIDRAPRYSRDEKALGADFEDTRLFRLTGGVAERLDGEPQLPGITLTSTLELNTGAASTLRDFIRFGKERYPAKHYAVWFVSHGEGPHSCPDETDDDELFTAELTDVLSERDSIDIIGFDACLMAGAENGYQWRRAPGKFGADFLIAAAPVSSSWPYEDIFKSLRTESKAIEASASSATIGNVATEGLSAAAFSAHIVEALRAQIEEGRSGDRGLELDLQSWGAFNLAAVGEAKVRLDALAVQLWKDNAQEELLSMRGSGIEAETFVYVWPERGANIHMPNVDLTHFFERVAGNKAFSDEARALAKGSIEVADRAVTASFGMSHYKGFEAGRHGLYFIFPEGSTLDDKGATYWSRTGWYSPILAAPLAEGEKRGRDAGYGGYTWCSDGATAGNGKVENWFELMDAWFDKPTAENPGGANGYVW
jgi:clostripain